MNIVERVKRICLSPDTEWEAIERESTPMSALLTGYVLPLAAISALAAAIAIRSAGFSLTTGLSIAIRSVVMSLAGVVVVAVIIDALAPTFGAVKSRERASKVAAYAPTPAWLAGVFQVLPFLGALIALLGSLYALYLLYLGLQRVMKAPQDKLVGYTVVVIVCAILVVAVVGYMTALSMGTGMRSVYSPY